MSMEGPSTDFGVIHGKFPALRSRQFRLMWAGQTISVAGSQMQGVALNWHIYALTHSTVALGMIGLVRVIPIVIFSLAGGAVADAMDRRRVLFATQVAMLCSAAALAYFTYTGKITVYVIYAITAFSAAAMAFNNPARQSLMPNLVPREHFANAASLTSVAHQLATILGPMIAGLLMVKSSLALIYGINAGSFLAVLIALILIGPVKVYGSSGEKSDISLAAMKEGLQFVMSTPILVWTIVLDFLATFFSSANALLPVFAKDILHVGARGYGILSAAAGVGSLAAGGAMSLMPNIRRQGWTVIWSVVVYGAATVVFGATSWFWLSWLALAATGAADTVSTVLRQTMRQMTTPDRLRGRMTAATMIFFMGGPQLGELEAGLVAKWVGAQWSVISGGLGCLVSVLIVAVRAKELRRYDRH